MLPHRAALKVLLLQIRQDEATRHEEFQEFVRFSGLAASQFTVLDVFHTPQFTPEILVGYDALLIGGSSDASVLKPQQYPFVAAIKQLLVACVAQSLPVFASCFGFQVAVEALGGRVILDEAAIEIGTLPLTLTAASLQDPLFHDVQQPFWACVGHQERAELLPPECEILASTPLCPYHAFKVRGRPFYAFQFHPEIDRADLSARLERYAERYLKETHHLSTIIQTLQETPQANYLICKFIDRVVIDQEGRN